MKNSFENQRMLYPSAVASMEENNYGEQYMPITPEELANLAAGNEGLIALHAELVDYAYRYATDVWGMHEFLAAGPIEGDRTREFAEKDEARSRLHNALIDSFRVFSRALAKEGRDNAWIMALESGGRAAYGRFALLLTYRLYCEAVEKQTNEKGERHD